MTRVEEVNPAGFAEAASRLLEESWPAPHPRFSPEYLRWQLGFPGALPPLAVAAFDGAEPVGFAGATPRCVRFRGKRWDVYVVSFVAVQPAWRGRAVGEALYAAMLERVRARGAPVVTFAAPESAARRVLLRAYAAAGFTVRSLGAFAGHGYLASAASGPALEATSRGGAAAAALVTRHVSDLSELTPLIAASDDSRVIRGDPGPDALEHARGDPRQPRGVLVYDAGGSAVAGAMLARPEVVERDGVRAITTVERVILPNPEAAPLRAVLTAAASAYPGAAGPSVISVPNVCGIDPATLRIAGLRRLPSTFDGFCCAADARHPLLAADSTDLEVV